MTTHIGDVVYLRDDALRVDQIRVTLREVRELMIGGTHNLVRSSDCAIDIGEKRIVELLSVLERLVVFRRVERCTEYAAVGVGEILGSVTQSLSLNRSTRG